MLKSFQFLPCLLEPGEEESTSRLEAGQVTPSYNRTSTKVAQSFIIGIKTFSKKDKNIITLLFFLTAVFIVSNIPMAVLRIMDGFDREITSTLIRSLINVLEVAFASSNFYLYCFCNERIRQKVRS